MEAIYGPKYEKLATAGRRTDSNPRRKHLSQMKKNLFAPSKEVTTNMRTERAEEKQFGPKPRGALKRTTVVMNIAAALLTC